MREHRFTGLVDPQAIWLDEYAVKLALWFIKDEDPPDIDPSWSEHVDKWTGMIDSNGRFTVESSVARRLEDMTARDYVESDRLDLDQLSV